MLNASKLANLMLLLASGLGLWAFLSPFFAPQQTIASEGMAHAQDAPFFFILLLGLCLLMLATSLETHRADAQMVALLGILTGINATLRLIPGIAGFNAVFFLPILCGYVFGAQYGFLVGSLSLLVSGLLTGGIGPWLPFQMFAAGWNGMVGGWIPPLVHSPRLEIAALAVWGFVSGFLFGAIMNLWFWPYLVDPSAVALNWEPNAGFVNTLIRSGIFYVVTSVWWDAFRAVGNVVLITFFGIPILRLSGRFRARFQYSLLDVSPA